MISKRTQDNLDMIKKYNAMSILTVNTETRKKIILECVVDIEQELSLNGFIDGREV